MAEPKKKPNKFLYAVIAVGVFACLLFASDPDSIRTVILGEEEAEPLIAPGPEIDAEVLSEADTPAVEVDEASITSCDALEWVDISAEGPEETSTDDGSYYCVYTYTFRSTHPESDLNITICDE